MCFLYYKQVVRLVVLVDIQSLVGWIFVFVGILPGVEGIRFWSHVKDICRECTAVAEKGRRGRKIEGLCWKYKPFALKK